MARSCHKNGWSTHSEASAAVGSRRIQEKTRKTKDKLQRYSEQGLSKNGINLGRGWSISSRQTWCQRVALYASADAGWIKSSQIPVVNHLNVEQLNGTLYNAVTVQPNSQPRNNKLYYTGITLVNMNPYKITNQNMTQCKIKFNLWTVAKRAAKEWLVEEMSGSCGNGTEKSRGIVPEGMSRGRMSYTPQSGRTLSNFCIKLIWWKPESWSDQAVKISWRVTVWQTWRRLQLIQRLHLCHADELWNKNEARRARRPTIRSSCSTCIQHRPSKLLVTLSWGNLARTWHRPTHTHHTKHISLCRGVARWPLTNSGNISHWWLRV